jgi:hypothetical protein
MYRFAMHRRQADKSEEREVALQPAGSKATKSRVKREEACSLSLSSWHDAGSSSIGSVPWSMQERQQDGEVAIDSSFLQEQDFARERCMHAWGKQ